MGLELKDWLALSFSATALIVAASSFYYSNFHKPATATLTLLGRTRSPEEFAIKRADHNIYKEIKTIVSVAKTNLSYSLSNTGKQALCIKSVRVLRGPSKKGNLRDTRGFLVLKSTDVPSFVLEPEGMTVMDVSFEDEKTTVDLSVDKYRLFSVEIVSADGSRYQICHDITSVMGTGSLHDRLWDGCALGNSVRSEWYS